MTDYLAGPRPHFVPPIMGARTRHERWYRVPVNARRLRRPEIHHVVCLTERTWWRKGPWRWSVPMPATRLPDNRRGARA